MNQDQANMLARMRKVHEVHVMSYDAKGHIYVWSWNKSKKYYMSYIVTIRGGAALLDLLPCSKELDSHFFSHKEFATKKQQISIIGGVR